MSVNCTKDLQIIISEYLGYWKMEEATGNREDCTGRGNVLGDTGAIGSTAGIIGTAAFIENVGAQSLNTGANAALVYDPATGVTIFGWFAYVGAIGGASPHVFTLLSYDSMNGGSVSQFFMVVRIAGALPTQILQLQFTDSVGTLENLNGPIKNDNFATFFVAWVDPADNRARVQFDNGAVITSTNVFNLGTGYALGRVASSNNPPNSSDHYIDECGIIGKVFSASERNALYNNFLAAMRPTCN